jgi:hypothetical protein
VTELLVSALLELLELAGAIVASVEGASRADRRVSRRAAETQHVEAAERAMAVLALIDQRTRDSRADASESR